MNFTLLNLPNLNKVEIELTTNCNLMCKFCDRRCSQAPAKENMSLEQIHNFINESIQLNYKWYSIGILGGEPTLHPDLEEIIHILRKYTLKFQICELFLVTNNYGEEVTKNDKKIGKIIKVIKRPKTNNPKWFNNVDLAPIDFSNNVHTCKITSECGLGLTTRGYSPCGPGAAVARVLDNDICIKSLYDVNQISMQSILKKVCMYCGHGLAITVGENNSISSFWKQVYQKYWITKLSKTRAGYNES